MEPLKKERKAQTEKMFCVWKASERLSADWTDTLLNGEIWGGKNSFKGRLSGRSHLVSISSAGLFKPFAELTATHSE